MGVLLATATLAGCASAYYGAMEQIGLEKRDLLVQRVNDAAVSQAHAKTEFANALEAFRAVVTVDAGELEVTYDKLTAAYERSADRADKVRDRIREVKGVASDLFKEWEKELYQYSDPALQRASRIQLEATKVRYATLVEKMDKAAASMDPVLAVFHDRVLFLKHNLNAMAIAALGPETAGLEADVDSLIRDMEASIAEADAFMAQMRGGV
ncbi:hypothetical protein HJO_12846 [Hyphomonas johnsonii MHS-2]|uniref:DNA repair ATPase n=2 Tax=Hyphomonas johnsonii TaxID=81031 RepID=A0A059FJB8_9PROT|nr:hypothetical protein HJO_12846 [Hyphomonas johnsonii MHS-2]